MSNPSSPTKPVNPVRVANVATALDLAAWARQIGERRLATDLEVYAECLASVDEGVA